MLPIDNAVMQRPSRAPVSIASFFNFRSAKACAVRIAVVAAAALASHAPAQAQAGGECNPSGNQQQLNACAVRDFQAADIALNIRYGHTMEKMDAPARMRLRQSQREWLRARDPGCKTQARGSEGGSAWPLFFYKCLEKATVARTKALEAGAAR